MQQNRNLTEIERQYTEEMPLEEAVDRAIRECIREDVLREFLENHRAEAKEMSIFEYDQEKHMRQEREAAWEAGEKTAGIEEGQTLWSGRRQTGRNERRRRTDFNTADSKETCKREGNCRDCRRIGRNRGSHQANHEKNLKLTCPRMNQSK